ncbi:preprotein translocase subunit SecE [Leptospira ellinghausenii]|nr:preprotein translocase subunit SecE [Leptospira ellinghausenii]
MVELGSPKSLVGVRFSPALPTTEYRIRETGQGSMKATSFIQECKAELEKVHWPTRQEVVSSTVVVLVTVFIFSLFLSASDFVFLKLLKWFWALGT